METTWGKFDGEIKGFRFEKKEKDHDHKNHETEDPTSQQPPYYAPAEKEFISAMQSIALRFGKLADNDANGIWANYVPKAKNDNYKIGVYCAHCAHYQSENVCKIIKAKIEPGGYCRLAAIPSELVNKKEKKK